MIQTQVASLEGTTELVGELRSSVGQQEATAPNALTALSILIIQTQVASLEGTTELVGELRSSVGRLEATVAGDAAVISDLRARLSASETKLETEAEAKVSVNRNVCIDMADCK